jgi:hypothetical protein
MTQFLSPDQAAQLDAFSRTAGTAAQAGNLDAAWTNFALRELARHDLVVACLAWRQATNAVRLAAYAQPLDAIADGSVVASAFAPDRIIATTIAPGEIAVTANGVLTTGVRYATHLVLDATLDGQRTALVVPAGLVSHVVRPGMAGLNAADNAFVSFDGTVGSAAILGTPGAAGEVIGLPYRLGMTMGAIALGGTDRILEMLAVDATAVADVAFGTLVGEHAAVEALVEAVPGDETGWRSAAAKLAATALAGRFCAYARACFGARAYAASHPLNGLERDLVGLAYQAPTNDNAARRVIAAISGP